MPTATVHTLTIPGWHPARLNTFANRHWTVRRRIKREDAEVVALYAKIHSIPQATGKRRVTLILHLAPRQRAGDPDSAWKSLLDSLVHCGLLIDDNRQGVELAPVEFVRGKSKGSTILLEDLE